MSRPKRALVTGADGFLGARLAARLVESGWEVVALVRRMLVPAVDGPAPRREPGDVTDADSVRAAATGCDAVFHCAWGGSSFEEARRINVQGTRHVLQAAAAGGARRVVHVSSMAVHRRPWPRVLDEGHPLVVRGDAYSVSKTEGERAAFEEGARSGVEVTSIRPSIVYGPRAPLWVLSYALRARLERVRCLDRGAGLLNLVYVEDVVDAMLAAHDTPAAAGESFLVSGAEAVSARGFLDAFARMCGKPLPRNLAGWRARYEMFGWLGYGMLSGRPRLVTGVDVALMTRRTAVSIQKARRLLGYAPRFDLSAGMAECERWLRMEGYLPAVAGRS